MNLAVMHDEMMKLFDLFNDYFYNNELSTPVIAIQTNGNSKRTLGWCTCGKVWKDHKKEESYYELTVCSEFLYRGIEEICTTLLHEMAHLYCNEKGIKDTSRNHVYHNKRFKAAAEEHGLIIEYDKRIGWSVTKLQEEAIRFIAKNVKEDLFVLTRKIHGEQQPTAGGRPSAGAKQSTRKYICPKCRTIIRATKEVNIICASCLIKFEKE